MNINGDKGLTQPLIDPSKKTSVSHIYKLSAEDLKLLFQESGANKSQFELLKERGLTEGVLRDLSSDKSTGIIGDEKDLKRRSDVFGANKKPVEPPVSFLKSIQDVASDKSWLFVGGTAIVSGISGWIGVGAGGLLEGISIIIASVFIILISAYADYQKDGKFTELQQKIKEESTPVIRGRVGATQTVSIWDLVVGDVILIETGARVPADCLVISGSDDLKVKEPIYKDGVTQDTQETKFKSSVKPDDKEFHNKDPFLKADSLVTSGSCRALVCCVGDNSTRQGVLSKDDLNADTPLQQKLENLAYDFTSMGLYCSLAIFVILIICMFIQISASDGKGDQTTFSIIMKKIPENINLVVVLVVVAIPEGLPLTIGISLAFSVEEMFVNKILVRRLNAPEKLGQIDDLLCSKTGSVTTAQMKVAEFYCESKLIKNTRKNTFLHCDLNPNTLEKIKAGILYNCEARVEMDSVNYVPVGNQTEVGLMKFLQDADIPVHILIQRKIDRIQAQVPFSSDKKFSAIALMHPEKQSTVVVHIKGAPEIIVNLCKKMSSAAGQRDLELQKDERDTITAKIDRMAASGLRVLAFASVEIEWEKWRDLLDQNKSDENGQIMSSSRILEDEIGNHFFDFSFIAAFGLKDPLRANVKKQVKFFRDECKITVRMVSGDHRQTAEAIAMKAGILRKDESRKPHAILSGEDFRRLVGEPKKVTNDDGTVAYELERPDQIEEIARNLRVLTRATAKDKYLLTLGLKNHAKKVAVTAEGINDCLALQAADVGIAFGSGCSAAKESADIILTDNDFGASLHAIMWGRNIYQNISRFLQCQATVNVSCLATVAIGSMIFGQSPLTSVQLLWINLIMDVFAALALSTEPPLQNVIKGKSIDSEDPILSKAVWRQIIGISAWDTIIMVVLMLFGQTMGNLDYDSYAPTSRTHPGSLDPKAADEKAEDFTTRQNEWKAGVEAYNDSQEKLRHLTWIFNTFVFLQIFNYINCRKVGERDFNVIEQFFHNKFFLGILVITFSFQYILTNIFYSIAGCVPLTKGEWGACLVVGSTPLLISVLLKLTPGAWVDRIPTDNLANEKTDPSRKKSMIVDTFNAVQGPKDQTAKGEKPTMDQKDEQMQEQFDDI